MDAVYASYPDLLLRPGYEAIAVHNSQWNNKYKQKVVPTDEDVINTLNSMCIIKQILQQKLICPVGNSPGGEAEQQYHARFKEIGLVEIPWAILADYSNRLTKVELRGNSLTSLPDKIFQMPVLKVLDVSNNDLVELCQEDIDWKCLQ